MSSRELAFRTTQPAPARLGLGVFRAPWTVSGAAIFVAIDARGECVSWKQATPGEEEQVSAHLWDVLDLSIASSMGFAHQR